MLNQEMLKDCGYKGQFTYSYFNPSFSEQKSLWTKGKNHPSLKKNWNNAHKNKYMKVGKTFGIEVERFIQYQNGLLLYFQNEGDTQYRGYCESQNIYFYTVDLGNRHLLHLTNGVESSQFFFQSKTFLLQLEKSLSQKVIQLNFTQKYQIIQTIGKGSFSNVFLARNKSNNKQYAVKIVNKKDKHGTPTKQIVQEQKKILSILNSEHICRMEQFFEDDNSYIFVLEHIMGKELMTHLKEKTQPFTFSESHFILKNLLIAIKDCHAADIIHRDLKPQNVIINPKTLKPKLIDFGLSLVYSPTLQKKKFRRCGTMGYMAFQVIQNTSEKCKPYDHKCDMFSFGIITHMVLFGKNPLKGKNYEQTYLKNTQWNFELKKDEIEGRYGVECYQLLQKLFTKNPTERLSAAQALGSDFFTKDPLDLKKKKQKKKEEKKEEDIDDFSQNDGELAEKMSKIRSLKTKTTMLGSEKS